MPTIGNMVIRKMIKEDGYTIDDNGVIYNRRGNKTPIHKKPYHACPKVTGHYYDNGKYKTYKVSAHRLAAYAYYGNAALDIDNNIVWCDGDMFNISKENLIIVRVNRSKYGGTKK